MSPPFFARNKKRKSRSRGASARRKPRNKSKVQNNAANRSMSVDVASDFSSNSAIDFHDPIAGSSGTGHYHQSKRDKSRNFKPSLNKNLRPYEGFVVGWNQNKNSESTISSLADKVATGAIAKAGSTLKNLSCGGTKKKMVSEEEQLDNLCSLLDRLDNKYGSSSSSPTKSGSNASVSTVASQSSTPSKHAKVHVLSDKENDANKTDDSPKKSPVKQNKSDTKSSPKKKKQNNESTAKTNEKPTGTDDGSLKMNIKSKDEDTLTQDEKKAIRKAKKEAKKQGKQTENNAIVLVENSEAKESKVSIEASIETDKADLKRQRRERQDAQRAAKAQMKKVNEDKKKTSIITVKESKPKLAAVKKKETISPSLNEKRVPFLSHLMVVPPPLFPVDVDNCYIHPAIRAVGLQMRDHIIESCNARVVATLSAICKLLDDYNTPSDREFSRDFADLLTYNIRYLNDTRPILESMNNVLSYVKREVNNLDNSLSEPECKDFIQNSIDTYINQNIVLASKTISKNVIQYMNDNEVILTFGGSLLVLDTIKEAANERENISLIIADSPIPASGLSMMKELADLNIKIYYRMLTDLHHVLQIATMVIVEAEAMCLNGAMVAPCGVSGLAYVACTKNIPVLALSHNYKLCNIDLHDSFVCNELGNGNDILRGSPSHRSILGEEVSSLGSNLNVINLMYDVTPPELIKSLVTERDHFPTSGVPSIIKKNYGKIWYHD